MTTGEAAAAAGVSRATVVYACDHGALRHAKHDAGDNAQPWRVIAEADLRAWLRQREAQRTAADARRERNRKAHEAREQRAARRVEKRAALLAAQPAATVARWRERGWVAA